MNKISIITPCFNAENYIEETLNSVLNQTAVLSQRVQLEYIICEGQSSDQTLDRIEQIRTRLQNPQVLTIISEPDHGMYEALAKGLKRASGEIIAYINAGDYYHKCAFDIVLDIFETKGVNWLTGYNVAYNDRSQVVYVRLPYRYRRDFFKCGYYGTKLPYLQQESTFWSGHLNALIDFERLAKFKYAGDFYLWFQFAQKAELKIVEAYLAGFRQHPGQLSENKSKYQAEVKTLIHKPRFQDAIVAAFDRVLWSTPAQIKKALNPQGILRYNHQLQDWV